MYKGVVLLVFILTGKNIYAQIAPVCPKREHIIEIHEDRRVDNYYWLNDYWLKGPDSNKVLAYLDAENQYYQQAMEPWGALQEKLYNEMSNRVAQTDESVPYFKNGYWYFNRTSEGMDLPMYIRKADMHDAPEEVLLNADKMSGSYAYFKIGNVTVSPDNRMMAFTVDTLSRNLFTIYFKDLETGELLEDYISNTTGAVVWANDSRTIFFATKDDTTLRACKVSRYEVGSLTSPKVVYEETDETYSVDVRKTKSDKFILIESYSTLSNEIRYLNASLPHGRFKVFLPRDTNHLYQIEDHENSWCIRTNWKADNFRIMWAPLRTTNKLSWTELVPYRKSVLIEDAEVFIDYLVLKERSKAQVNIRVIPWDKRKAEQSIVFKDDAYTAYLAHNPDYHSEVVRYGYTSLTTPYSTYEYNTVTHQVTLLKEQEIHGYNKNDYKTERIWVQSRDGVKIPVSIVYKKSFKQNGKHPLLLYAYGSYGANMDPTFSTARLSLLDRGFAYAIAHVRGGEEMGREWYENGKMFQKKNSFTDFIDVAEYLLDNGYTSKEHLYAEGGSAGGLLVGAVVNMRPELWHGVIAAVPFVDVVTTMMDERIPLTTGEYDEWGNPDEKDAYWYMKSYSPYDNVAHKPYPNILVTTGLHDSQVQYFEPVKWVAKLREMKTDNNKLLLYTNMEAGHGGATGRFKRIEEATRHYTFLLMLEGIAE